MRNTTFTITLPVDTVARIEERALAAGTTPGKHTAALIEHALTRPTWDQVADDLERQALAAEVERVTGQRDRARTLAALLEAENAQLMHLFSESVPGLQSAVQDLQAAIAEWKEADR